MKNFIPLCLFLLFLSACFGAQKPAPVQHYGTKSGAGSAGMHSVLPGDTLWSVSKRYSLPMRDIAAANDLGAPFALETGQRLKLPPPREYRARKGDTLYAVSRIFGVSTSEVAALNRLQPPYAIEQGQVLRLPVLTRMSAPLVHESPSNPLTLTLSPKGRGDKGELPLEGEGIREEISPPAVGNLSGEAHAKITALTPKRESGKFLIPVAGPVISKYGPKPDGLHNDGINIRVPLGAPVRAAENGVVVYAGSELKGSGNLVLIRHEDRWMSAYAHLDRIAIRRGDTVRRGQSIGTAGQSGWVDSPQLHFELRRGTEAINPERYLES